MITILGEKLYIVFLIDREKVTAYAIHYAKNKAIEHLYKIKKFHKLSGEIKFNKKLGKEYERKINEKILKDKNPKIDLEKYKYNEVYKYLLFNVKKGTTITYKELANKTGYNVRQVVFALKHNPYLIIIPCHRVVSKNNIGGYTPLGKEFKRKFLEVEGVSMFFKTY